MLFETSKEICNFIFDNFKAHCNTFCDIVYFDIHFEVFNVLVAFMGQSSELHTRNVITIHWEPSLAKLGSMVDGISLVDHETIVVLLPMEFNDLSLLACFMILTRFHATSHR